MKIMFENKTKVLVVIFVLIPLMITFMASPLIVHNEETRQSIDISVSSVVEF